MNTHRENDDFHKSWNAYAYMLIEHSKERHDHVVSIFDY